MHTPLYSASTIIPAYDREALMRLWQQKAHLFLERAGTNPRFAQGGHDIKNNHLLTETIHEIAQGYLALCYKKASLFAKANEQMVGFTAQHAEDGDVSMRNSNITQTKLRAQAEIEQLNPDFLKLLDDSIRRLKNCEGFKAEKTRLALADDEKLIKAILGKIITRAIATAIEFSQVEKFKNAHTIDVGIGLQTFVPRG